MMSNMSGTGLRIRIPLEGHVVSPVVEALIASTVYRFMNSGERVYAAFDDEDSDVEEDDVVTGGGEILEEEENDADSIHEEPFHNFTSYQDIINLLDRVLDWFIADN